MFAHCTDAACIRSNLAPRFHALGLLTTRLPVTAGPSDPHIPILSTANLSAAKRILLYIGESTQDLGIFAYRTCGQEALAAGSCLNFAADALKQGTDVAVVMANPGQPLWNRRNEKAMSFRSWHALPRKTAVGAPTRMGEKNKVPGHEDIEKHVESVFGFVGGQMAEGAKVELLGICEGIEHGLGFLDCNWEEWKGKMGAMCIGSGHVWDINQEVQNEELKSFMEKVGFCFSTYLPTG